MTLRGAAARRAVTAAGGFAAFFSHRARHVAPYRPVLECISIDAFPRSLDAGPIRLGFITDTHIGPAIAAADVDRAIATLLDGRPDLLLLGGDYICESPRFITEATAVLGDAANAVPLGAVAVLGNHDYSNDACRLVTQFERKGIRVLRNASALVEMNGGALWIVGIDDAILGSPDPDLAFADIPTGEAVIALWHEPDWAAEVARYKPVMQLSGHSHGGQVRLPILGALGAPAGGRRYVQGLNDVSGMPLYTSRGVGVFRPPVRFACPPEITLLTMA